LTKKKRGKAKEKGKGKRSQEREEGKELSKKKRRPLERMQDKVKQMIASGPVVMFVTSFSSSFFHFLFNTLIFSPVPSSLFRFLFNRSQL